VDTVVGVFDVASVDVLASVVFEGVVDVVIDDLIDVSFGSFLLEFPVTLLCLVGVILIGVFEGKPNKRKKHKTFFIFEQKLKIKKHCSVCSYLFTFKQKLWLFLIIYLSFTRPG
jgi:hypothetical protein